MARKGLPAKYIKQAKGDLKKAWRMYRSKRGKRKSSSRSRRSYKKRSSTRSKRSSGRKMSKARTGVNFLLGCAGSWIGEELEVHQIRPRLEKAGFGGDQKGLVGQGGVDMAAGFALNYVANRVGGGRNFFKGMSWSIGGKGLGKLKHAATGAPGLFR